MAGDTDEDRRIPDWLRPFVVVAAFVAVMWVVEAVDLLPRTDLDRFGIRPRTLVGLRGIVFAPFLHAGPAHLLSNTVPFLILGWLVAASGTARFLEVTAIVALISGAGTWLTGTPGQIHIGASGLVVGYLTYLAARAVFEKRFLYLVGAAVVLFLYGSILWGLLPRPGISWQGHLFGALGGVIAARLLHRPGERSLPEIPHSAAGV